MIQRAAIAFALTIGVGLGGYLYGRHDGRGLERAAMAAATARMQANIVETTNRAAELGRALKNQAERNVTLLQDYNDAIASDTGAVACVPSANELRAFRELSKAARAKAGQSVIRTLP